MSMLILKTLLFSSVTAIILSTLLLLFQRLGRVKLSARIAKWAWVACLLTLFLPLYFLTNVNSLTTVVQNSPVRSFQYGDGVEIILNQNVAGYFNQPDPVNPNSVIQGNDLGEKSLPQENNLPASGTATSQGATGSALDFFKTLSIKEIGLSLWLIGALFMGSKFTWRYQKARKLLLENSQLLDSESLPEFVRKYSVRIASIHSPMVFGILRPTIFLPRVIKEKDALYYALLHEYTHIKNRDLLLKFIAEMAVVIHWFNPLVRMIRQRISIASEDACDEKLSLGMNEDQRKSYAWAILSFMDTTIPENTLTSGVMSMSNSTIPVKARLLRILKCQKMGRPMWVIAALVVLLSLTASLLIACGVTVPGKDSASTSESSESSAAQETTVPTTENKTEVPESQPSENLVAKSDAEMAKRLPEATKPIGDLLGVYPDGNKESNYGYLFTFNPDTGKLLAYSHYDKVAHPPIDLTEGALTDGSVNKKALPDSEMYSECYYYYDSNLKIWRVHPFENFDQTMTEFKVYYDFDQILSFADNLARYQPIYGYLQRVYKGTRYQTDFSFSENPKAEESVLHKTRFLYTTPDYNHYYDCLEYSASKYFQDDGLFLEIDLNGDDKKEKIAVVKEGTGYKLSLDDIGKFSIPLSGFEGIRIVDIDQSDNFVELVADFFEPSLASNDVAENQTIASKELKDKAFTPKREESYIVRFDGSKVTSYKGAGAWLREVYGDGLLRFYSVGEYGFLDMNRIEDVQVNDQWEFTPLNREYELEKEVVVQKAFTVTFFEEGQESVGKVNPGELLIFTKSNFQDKIYFTTADNRKGVLKITNFQEVGQEKIPAKEAFKGLVYFD